eukprot:TRINITY_DN3280_c0_g1_i4.p1 TRINITY_DN3280_c0_g1~~TRINITY_DN3280_c0_g1_i4.p1  ORF type:complete len:152 (-),score=40.77 TRINITY_DN3280_c0_g1_i4:38-493(-)
MCIRDRSTWGVQHEGYLAYIQMNENGDLGAFVFCDAEYPRRLAFALIKKALEEYNATVRDNWKKFKSDENIPCPAARKLFLDYQDPKKVDALSAAQENVERTQVIMHDNIQKLLARNEDIDQLVQKSKDFSLQSKVFYKNSKKMNKCCTLF